MTIVLAILGGMAVAILLVLLLYRLSASDLQPENNEPTVGDYHWVRYQETWVIARWKGGYWSVFEHRHEQHPDEIGPRIPPPLPQNYYYYISHL